MPDAEVFAAILKLGGPASIIAGAIAWRLVVTADSKLGLSFLRRVVRELLKVVSDTTADVAALREELRQVREELAELRTRNASRRDSND